MWCVMFCLRMIFWTENKFQRMLRRYFTYVTQHIAVKISLHGIVTQKKIFVLNCYFPLAVNIVWNIRNWTNELFSKNKPTQFIPRNRKTALACWSPCKTKGGTGSGTTSATFVPNRKYPHSGLTDRAATRSLWGWHSEIIFCLNFFVANFWSFFNTMFCLHTNNLSFHRGFWNI